MNNFKIVLIDCVISMLSVIIFLVLLVNVITDPGVSPGVIPVMALVSFIPIMLVLGMFTNFSSISRCYDEDPIT